MERLVMDNELLQGNINQAIDEFIAVMNIEGIIDIETMEKMDRYHVVVVKKGVMREMFDKICFRDNDETKIKVFKSVT